MKCKNCGNENKPGAKFCPNCGFSLKTAKEKNQAATDLKKSTRTPSRSLVWIWVIAGLGVLIILGGLFLIFKGSSIQVIPIQFSQGNASPAQQNSSASTSPSCNGVGNIVDVTINDGTQMKTGETFIKIWGFTNAGTCTWDTNYKVIFSSGALMGAFSPVKIGKIVPPGDTIEIRIKMKAPSQPGEYSGNWEMQASDGTRFGWGDSLNQPFWVKIIVTS